MYKKEGINNTAQTRKALFAFILFIICSGTFYFLIARLGLLMPLWELPSVACLHSCKPEQSVHPLPEGNQILNHNKSLKEILGGKASGNASILIEKSKYRLTLFSDLQPIKSYPVVFGNNPTGDKLREGDLKTPEGVFYIFDLYSHPSWSKFIWLNYPTPQAWREHFQAKLSGKISWTLPIGGQVGIHGVPEGQDSWIDKRSNWTWGCISLKNDAINEIYSFVSRETLVEIVP